MALAEIEKERGGMREELYKSRSNVLVFLPLSPSQSPSPPGPSPVRREDSLMKLARRGGEAREEEAGCVGSLGAE